MRAKASDLCHIIGKCCNSFCTYAVVVTQMHYLIVTW